MHYLFAAKECAKKKAWNESRSRGTSNRLQIDTQKPKNKPCCQA